MLHKIITQLDSKLGRYLIAGVISVIADYGVLLFLYRIANTKLITATVVAFFLGLIVNFVLNKFWAFSDSGTKTLSQAALYVLLVCFNLAFTYYFVAFCDSNSIGPEFSKPIATILTVGWNFILYKKLIFRSR